MSHYCACEIYDGVGPKNIDSRNSQLQLQTFVQNPDLDSIMLSFSVCLVPVLTVG
jgi:hypothetical protein